MNEVTERAILEVEYRTLSGQIQTLGYSGLLDTSPKQDGSLDHLSLSDLRQSVKMLRDLARSLGGIRPS
jgi:hypothetical protein